MTSDEPLCDEVAIDRALRGDRSVTLYAEERRAILARARAGTLPPVGKNHLQRLLRLNGQNFRDALAGTYEIAPPEQHQESA